MYLLMFFFSHSYFVANGGVEYFLLIRGLIILQFTAIEPTKQSYSLDNIIPFAMNLDCIKSMDMAMMLPLSTASFYSYLEDFCPDKDGLIYFAMYADLRQLQRL